MSTCKMIQASLLVTLAISALAAMGSAETMADIDSQVEEVVRDRVLIDMLHQILSKNLRSRPNIDDRGHQAAKRQNSGAHDTLLTTIKLQEWCRRMQISGC